MSRETLVGELAFFDGADLLLQFGGELLAGALACLKRAGHLLYFGS